MSKLEAATVLITGAGGGFGQELTHQLLAKGSRLILTDHPSVNLSEMVKTLDKNHQDKVVACFSFDLAGASGCKELYAAVQQLKIVPDILINNAGIALVGSMTDIPSDRWETMMQINLLTPMRLSSLFAADMIARQQGHIVDISSLAGWIAAPGLTAYAASKYGLRGFSEGLRYELSPHNVKVTTVYPFFSRTPLLKASRFGRFATLERDLPQALTTDPKKIMAKTIRAIERNQAEVFPDNFAWAGQWIKRYVPFALSWLRLINP
ncbi:MAG: SDR family NAD(P)-dependent oxidoreductase [Cyanobacteria bacterium P01_D01_bin.156]